MAASILLTLTSSNKKNQKKSKEPSTILGETTKVIVATNQGREPDLLPLDSIYARLWGKEVFIEWCLLCGPQNQSLRTELSLVTLVLWGQ